MLDDVEGVPPAVVEECIVNQEIPASKSPLGDDNAHKDRINIPANGGTRIL